MDWMVIFILALIAPIPFIAGILISAVITLVIGQAAYLAVKGLTHTGQKPVTALMT